MSIRETASLVCRGTVVRRRESHTIALTVELAHAATIGEVTATAATIVYQLVTVDDDDARWTCNLLMHAGNRTATLRHDPQFGTQPHHDWPDPMLAEVADQLHPARPGGWPGDDPTGSYL